MKALQGVWTQCDFPSQINLPHPHYPYYPHDNASNNWNKCVIEIYAAEWICSENFMQETATSAGSSFVWVACSSHCSGGREYHLENRNVHQFDFQMHFWFQFKSCKSFPEEKWNPTANSSGIISGVYCLCSSWLKTQTTKPDHRYHFGWEVEMKWLEKEAR